MIELTSMSWQRSTQCAGGSCVEVARAGDQILVRNSTVPDSAVAFTEDEWDAFLRGVQRGEFR